MNREHPVDGAGARALRRYSEMQEVRVRALYNRHRAVFAEFLVEQLLPGAHVEEDPSSSWDLVWPVAGIDHRVQVKCSGSYLPRTRRHGDKPEWKLAAPKKGWDPVRRIELAAGHHCNLFVLARHVGTDIANGWSFAVLSAVQAAGRNRVTMKSLGELGLPLVEPSELHPAALRALG